MPDKTVTLTAGQVMALGIGKKIKMCGVDENGQQRTQECTVAGTEEKKFLTYRINGQIKLCRIKDYPGKSFTI